LLSGRGTLIQLPLLKRLRFREERLQTELSNGYRIVVFPNEFIGRSVYYFGEVDPKVTGALRMLLDKGDTLIDIGANVGVVSLQCLESVGPGGRVVAVEPQRQCCEALRSSIALNGIANLELYESALSDRAGRSVMHLEDPGNFGTAKLCGNVSSQKAESVDVLDASAFLTSLEIAGEYVLKIDVEGHEGNVLLGCAPFMKKRTPKAVVFESTSHKYEGADFFQNPAYTTLTSIGLKVFQIHKSLFAMKLTEVRESSGAPQATDFVALPPHLIGRLNSAIEIDEPLRRAS
jgi:FkbM family methyltransferase